MRSSHDAVTLVPKAKGAIALLLCTILTQPVLAQSDPSPFSPQLVNILAPPILAPGVDWDLDGIEDLVFAGTGYLSVQFGQPGGGFGPLIRLYISAAGISYRAAFVLDLNRDGILDIIVEELDASNQRIGFVAFAGDGMRGILPPESLPLSGGMGGQTLLGVYAVDAPSAPRPVLIVVGSNGSGSSRTTVFNAIAYDAATLAWAPQSIGSLPSSGVVLRPQFPARPSDFDGDGLADWLTISSQSIAPFHYAVVFRGLSAAPWVDLRAPILFPLPAPTLPTVSAATIQVALDDANGDGMTDLFYLLRSRISASGQPAMFQHDIYALPGSPTGLSPATAIRTALAAPDSLEVARSFLDFDGDGRLDLLLLETSTGVGGSRPFQVQVHRGYSDWTFAAPMRSPWQSSWAISGASVKDVDGDRDPDLIVYLGRSGGPYFAHRIWNETFQGLGEPASSGLTPRIRPEVARIGNPSFGIGIDQAPPLAPAVLALSLGVTTTPQPIGVDLSTLLWPIEFLGPLMTDAAGAARHALPSPLDPRLAGAVFYAQWGVATNTTFGLATTAVAKVILWP